MWYSWKDVGADIIIGLIFGMFWLMIGVGVAKLVTNTDPNLFIMAMQINIVMFGLGALLLNQLHCWDTGVQSATHGWPKKICSVVGANVACMAPFIVSCFFI